MTELGTIRQALSYIPAHDRDLWIKMGMGIKSELGDGGFPLWDEWGGQDSSYNPMAAASAWRSFKECGRVGIGSVFHEAQLHGFRFDSPSQQPAPDPAELAEQQRQQKEAEAARQAKADQAAMQANVIWNKAKSCLIHAYTERKRIAPQPARMQFAHADECKRWFWSTNDDGELVELAANLLVLPLYSISGDLRGLQAIDEKGRKSLIRGLGKQGLFIPVTGIKLPADYAGRLYIEEGFATAATIRQATGDPALAAIDAGNLLHVARAWRQKCPRAEIIICGDLDKSDIGQKKAREAAMAVGGMAVLPPFTVEQLACNEPPSDWNDFAALHGVDGVKQALEDSLIAARAEHRPDSRNVRADDSDGSGWQEPQPLAVKVEAELYPLDALPNILRAAVQEVAGFVKAPVPLVVASAVAALSLAIQAHADVKRADKLTGPTALFLLTIADSGERKSTCDGFFMTAIRDYEEAQAEAAKPILKDYKAASDAWEAKCGGIKDKIRHLAKDSKPTAEMESALRDLEHDKPEPPGIPRLLYADATPEALAHGLAKQWPSGGVVSAEAGIVFGSHGMGKDSVMRNLAMLNQLWDGNSLTIDRRTTESFTVRGARLTVGLQVQEPTLREFFSRSGALARGTGFLARFLVAWPESTQGFRPFTEAPATWQHLTAFNRRIASILDQPAPIDEDGALTPAMLALTVDAKAAWVAFHDAIESELASGGELYDVRDVASKSADNAVRLAALFQIFEHGMGGAVGLECFESASRIAAWHLNEARRFFGELALPLELADAARLDTWLIGYCQRERTHFVPIAKLQQGGPTGLRSKATIETAMRELEEAGRARWVRDGKRKMIAMNPALLSEGGPL
ncbi:DUF3987 domain-containing protein [Nitrosospira sp. Nsp13]|uniref:DUF3987 domain-containing protein n=1 Tax=Nitrosospira sp. Nsp13 TaxID=1855332 RepID=UPI0008843F41|nr:DUF3987 domain-containing protein [Nitrosospira sp. Nsp13]SCY38277.1 putative DNA primase/helicase [Nitrosospira sp. Nsp13]